jgi:4-amino-4-deoxy-L-arabinose transferase-like glycosyltransferase
MAGDLATSGAPRWAWTAAIVLVVANLLWTGGLALSHDKALNDRLSYYLVAETLASGGGLASPAQSTPRGPDLEPPYAVGERPLFPFLVSLAFRLVGPSVRGANFVSALVRSLALLPVFALALRLFDHRVALGAAILYTLSPPWTGLGATSMSDATFALFFYLALWAFVVNWQAPSIRGALLAGGALALAALTREEGLFLGLFLAVVLLIRRRWVALAAFLAAPIVLLGGWQLYLWQTFGSLPYTARPLVFLPEYELFLLLTLPTRQQYLAAVGGWLGALNIRLFNYVGYLRNLLADGLLLDTGQAGLFPPTFLLPLAVVGWELAQGWRAKERRARLVLLLALAMAVQAAITLGYVGYPQAMVGEIRHIQVITPFLFILATAGLVRLWDRSQPGRGLAALLAAHFLIFCVIYQFLLVEALVVAPPYNSADIQALRQVAPTLGENVILMSRKPNRAAYYTARPAAIMPLAGFRDLMEYAQAHGVTHLVIQPRELRTRPGLQEGLVAAGESIHLVVKVGNTQILQVRNYDFLPAIAEGGPLDGQVDPAAPVPPPDWAALLRHSTPSTLSLLRTASAAGQEAEP